MQATATNQPLCPSATHCWEFMHVFCFSLKTMLRPFAALTCILLMALAATAAQGPDSQEQQFASVSCAEICDKQQVECYRRSIMYCVVETGAVINATLRKRLTDNLLEPEKIMEEFAEDNAADPQRRCMHTTKGVCDDLHTECLERVPCVPPRRRPPVPPPVLFPLPNVTQPNDTSSNVTQPNDTVTVPLAAPARPPVSSPAVSPKPPPDSPPAASPTPPPDSPPAVSPTPPPDSPPAASPTPPPDSPPAVSPTPPPDSPPAASPTPPPNSPPAVSPRRPPESVSIIG